MISFARIDLNDMPWENLREFKGANIFHTRPWIEFLADYERAEPVIATVQSGNQTQGYFTGLIFNKIGLRILGSPYNGWDTFFMGFNLKPGVSYHEVLQAFPRFVFNDLKCHFLMIIDSNLEGDELKGLSYNVRKTINYALDLTKTEAELFANMKGNNCRRAIRGAEKKGVVIEETADPGFADEYFAQHQELLVRKSSPPDFRLDFVRQMITRLLPTGNLLLLRARNPEGDCIATHIDLVFNKVAVYWGGASWQQYFNLHPNELIYWYAIKRAKAMGAEMLRLGSTLKQFKEKFGAYETHGFVLRQAKNPIYYFLAILFTSFTVRMRDWIFYKFGRRLHPELRRRAK